MHKSTFGRESLKPIKRGTTPPYEMGGYSVKLMCVCVCVCVCVWARVWAVSARIACKDRRYHARSTPKRSPYRAHDTFFSRMQQCQPMTHAVTLANRILPPPHLSFCLHGTHAQLWRTCWAALSIHNPLTQCITLFLQWNHIRSTSVVVHLLKYRHGMQRQAVRCRSYL